MKYFTIPELTRSSYASANKIDNTPSEAEKQNLIALVENILDPIREQWGEPILVNSGYRCPTLNKAIGGSPSSMHMRGLAADIRTKYKADLECLFGMIQEMADLPFDKLLFEHNAKGSHWLHITFDPSRPLVTGNQDRLDARRIVIDDYYQQ